MAIEDDMISLLEEKIKRVIRFAEALQNQNGKLQQQIDRLSGLLHEKGQDIEVLELKYERLKLAKSLASSPDDNKNVKLQVSRMVREIDKCIALLNR